MTSRHTELIRVRSFEEWHEDDYDVLWWHFPIRESPYVGCPLASDWPFTDADSRRLGWTPFDTPACVINPVSSRICRIGTKCCDVDHG